MRQKIRLFLGIRLFCINDVHSFALRTKSKWEQLSSNKISYKPFLWDKLYGYVILFLTKKIDRTNNYLYN